MMKKRNILYWAMGVILMPLLGSCTSDDVIGSAGREEHDITSGQPMTVTSVTRAADGRTLSTQFENGEIVWMWANKSPSNSEYIKAWQLIADGTGGFLSSAAKYWPSDGSLLNVHALHGNFGTNAISENTTPWPNLSLFHTVKTDQSSPENKRLSDLLYSQTSSPVEPNHTVQLTFDHLLAKITVKLDLNGSEGIKAGELANATVTLTNMLTTCEDFNTANVSTITTTGVSADEGESRTVITAGEITQPSAITTADNEVGSAIVPLQNFGGGKSSSADDNVITITLASPDNRSFSYKPTPSVDLTAGNEYIYTLKIINGKLSVSSITVNPFTTETTQEKNWPIYVGS